MITKSAEDFLTKFAGVLNPYSLEVDNADFLSDEDVAKILQLRMANKANDTPTSWTRAMASGAVPGGLAMGLATRSIPAALVGAASGAIIGGGMKFNDDQSRKQAIKDLERIKNSKYFQRSYVADAKANAQMSRAEQAHLNALEHNARMSQLHSDMFGGQQLRGIVL